MLKFLKKLLLAIFLGFTTFVITTIVLVWGIMKFLFSREELKIRYTDRNGKVVNLDDFRANKTGGEL